MRNILELIRRRIGSANFFNFRLSMWNPGRGIFQDGLNRAKGFEITDDTSNWHILNLTLRLFGTRDQNSSIKRKGNPDGEA